MHVVSGNKQILYMKHTFQWTRHLKPLRQPLLTLVNVKAISIDPSHVTGLKGGEKHSIERCSSNKYVWTAECETLKSCWVADLSDFWVTQLMRAQLGQSAVQLEELQCMAVQPPANQESGEARRQEEERADTSLHWPQTDRRRGGNGFKTAFIFHCVTSGELFFTDHLIHAHPLYTQRGSREQAPNGKDFRPLGVFSTLHLKTRITLWWDDVTLCPPTADLGSSKITFFTHCVG